MKYFLYCLKHYADFEGRARRSEFWYYTLFHFLFVFLPIFIGLILLLAGGAFQDYSTSGSPSALIILGALLSFVGIIASLGLLVNLLVAKIMLNSDHDNLNIKAAYLHVLTDLFGSIIAILSGLSAYFLGWLWVDPLASMILSMLVLKSGIGTFRLALKNI